MKKIIKISAFILSLTLLITASVSVRAEEIPRSSVPQNATEESILITGNLISGIPDEVSQGLGYLEARIKANNLIYDAILSGQASGYGHGLLFPIACNAIFEYRDIYLRPDFYVAAEANVRNTLADLITQVETGMAYEEARKEAINYRDLDGVEVSKVFDGESYSLCEEFSVSENGENASILWSCPIEGGAQIKGVLYVYS